MGVRPLHLCRVKMDLMADLMHGRKGITNRLAYETLPRKGTLSRPMSRQLRALHARVGSAGHGTVSTHCIIDDDDTLGGTDGVGALWLADFRSVADAHSQSLLSYFVDSFSL